MMKISRQTHRRFVLGRQGLWPGRRYRGFEGVIQAMQEMQALQLDPLNIAARSQEIALYGRVLEYELPYLYQAAYEQRRFFDYGGNLNMYPMEELPYWRWHMQRKVERPYWQQTAAEHAEAIEAVLKELEARGPLSNRDFSGTKRINSYRGRKDTALALYYLWITGRVMIHHRVGFDRVYDLTGRVAPPEFQGQAGEAETEAYFARKALAFVGLSRQRPWEVSVAEYLQRPIDREEGGAWMRRLLDEGAVLKVQVEGEKEPFYGLAADAPLLEALEAGQAPDAWQPLAGDTCQEAVLLAPLEIASARGRAKKLFDFDYVWEVYKPLEQRRWGYYNLPVLYGDRLAARLDPRLDRKSMTLYIEGLWIDDPALPEDGAFRQALAAGVQRFARLLGAQAVDVSKAAAVLPGFDIAL